MPLWDFNCIDCNHIEERICSHKENEIQKCSLCGGKMVQLFSGEGQDWRILGLGRRRISGFRGDRKLNRAPEYIRKHYAEKHGVQVRRDKK